MAFTLFTQSFGIANANSKVTISEVGTGAPATILATDSGGIVSDRGITQTDSSGDINVYIDTAKTWQVSLVDETYSSFQSFSNDDVGVIVFDAPAADDDAPNFAAALASALEQRLILRVPSGRTIRLISAVDINCGHTWGDMSQFGLVVDGLIHAGPGIKALTIRNCWFGKFSLRFAGGGSTVDDSGFRLVGGYNNAVEIEGDLYAGTLLEIENGLSSGAGGNGRIDIKRLVTRNCGRPIEHHHAFRAPAGKYRNL